MAQVAECPRCCFAAMVHAVPDVGAGVRVSLEIMTVPGELNADAADTLSAILHRAYFQLVFNRAKLGWQ